MLKRKAARLHFHHLIRIQCLVDGAAFFGIRSNEDPEWGQRGRFRAREFMHPLRRKLKAKSELHGEERFRVNWLMTDVNRHILVRRLNDILRNVKNHPLSLNFSREEIYKCIAKGKLGKPLSDSHKASQSRAKIGNKNGFKPQNPYAGNKKGRKFPKKLTITN